MNSYCSSNVYLFIIIITLTFHYQTEGMAKPKLQILSSVDFYGWHSLTHAKIPLNEIKRTFE